MYYGSWISAKELEMDKSSEFALWFRSYLVNLIEQNRRRSRATLRISESTLTCDWGVAKNGLKHGCKNDQGGKYAKDFESHMVDIHHLCWCILVSRVTKIAFTTNERIGGGYYLTLLTPPIQWLETLGACPRTPKLRVQVPFLPNSSLFQKNNARNINYMPALIFLKCLDFEQNCYSRTSS